MKYAPIIISVYDRLDHLKKCIESLQKNELACYSELYVISDAAYKEEHIPLIDAVRTYINGITGFKKVYPVFRERNMGGNQSIRLAYQNILQIYDSFISLEDDIVVSSDFLQYMNTALEFYKNDERIFSICGFKAPFLLPKDYKGDVYFYPCNSPWGIATWKDRWEQVDWEIQDWKELVNNKKQQKAFNKNGSDMYSMLKGYMEGKNHSWAIRFCYNQFKLGKYSVCPFLSKINNEGFGENATNCKQTLPNSQIDRECYKYHSIPIRVYCKIRETLHL